VPLWHGVVFRVGCCCVRALGATAVRGWGCWCGMSGCAPTAEGCGGRVMGDGISAARGVARGTWWLGCWAGAGVLCRARGGHRSCTGRWSSGLGSLTLLTRFWLDRPLFLDGPPEGSETRLEYNHK
jgi:hypothetical protein